VKKRKYHVPFKSFLKNTPESWDSCALWLVFNSSYTFHVSSKFYPLSRAVEIKHWTKQTRHPSRSTMSETKGWALSVTQTYLFILLFPNIKPFVLHLHGFKGKDIWKQNFETNVQIFQYTTDTILGSLSSCSTLPHSILPQTYNKYLTNSVMYFLNHVSHNPYPDPLPSVKVIYVYVLSSLFLIISRRVVYIHDSISRTFYIYMMHYKLEHCLEHNRYSINIEANEWFHDVKPNWWKCIYKCMMHC
jgi:hypothetical protein